MKAVAICVTFPNKEFLFSKCVSHASPILLFMIFQSNHFYNNCHGNFKYTIYSVLIRFSVGCFVLYGCET